MRTGDHAAACAGRWRNGMTAKILVVDDEHDLEELVRQKFRGQIKDGSIVFGFARDGVEALALLADKGDFDMVVSDINMPRMDGLTLLAKLQDQAAKFSTVVVSAYGDMANIRAAMNRGAFDFLTKPIDFTDFETTIRKTIAHVADLKDARKRQAEAERAHASLARYFSPNLARSLAADADALAPGREQREIATLFTDIAGFMPLRVDELQHAWPSPECVVATSLCQSAGRLPPPMGSGMRRSLLLGNREISIAVPCQSWPGRSGRPEAVADDERDGEVGTAHSSAEASEQGGLGCCGAHGAKGQCQREFGSAKHGPDAEPGSRVTGAAALAPKPRCPSIPCEACPRKCRATVP
jgi:CheY-like chemotaxis protein